jgi:hypothetical protein
MSADLWLDKGSGRLTEFDIHAAENGGAKADVTVLIGTPDPSAFVTPATSTNVPLAPLLGTLMQSFGGSLMP